MNWPLDPAIELEPEEPSGVQTFCAVHAYRLPPEGAFVLKKTCPTAHSAGRTVPVSSLPCLVRSTVVCPSRHHALPIGNTIAIPIHRGVFICYPSRRYSTVFARTASRTLLTKLSLLESMQDFLQERVTDKSEHSELPHRRGRGRLGEGESEGRDGGLKMLRPIRLFDYVPG